MKTRDRVKLYGSILTFAAACLLFAPNPQITDAPPLDLIGPDSIIWACAIVVLFQVAIIALMILNHTRRKNIQKELSASVERYQSLFDHSPEGIGLISLDGKFLDCNRAMEDLIRLPKAKIVGRHFTGLDILPSKSIYQFLRLYKRLENAEGTNNLELYIIDREGQVRWIEVFASLLRKKNVPQAVQVIVRDITERKWAEHASSEEKAFAEALRDTAAMLNSTLDLDKVLSRVLANVWRVVYHDAANIMLVENGIARVVGHRGYMERGLEADVMAVRYEVAKTTNLQHMTQTKDCLLISNVREYPGWILAPHTEWIRSNLGVPIISTTGEVIGFINLDSEMEGFFTPEHAERLQGFATQAAVAIRNAQLYEAEQNRRQIAETLQQATAVLNTSLELEEVLNLILEQLSSVIDYDSAAIQRLDAGNNTLVIHACQYFDHPDKVVGLRFPIEPKFPNMRVVRERKPLAIDDVTVDYPHFQVEANSFESGHIRSWLGVPLIARDKTIGIITLDRKTIHPFTEEETGIVTAFANQAAVAIENAALYDSLEGQNALLEERVRERTIQLEEANRHLRRLSELKDEFVANVSHELRTPIANIKLYHHLLGSKPESSEKYLATLQRETNRLEKIVEDILHISRIDQGELNLMATSVDLNSIAESYVTDRQALAKNRLLTLNLETNQNIPLVLADQGMLGQVFSIILTNAINYTPEEGQIDVRVIDDVRDGQPWAGFSISDSGPGIPEDERDRLFERFFRGLHAQDSGVPGTGLGLSIAKEIIDRHEGQIEVTYQGINGTGVTFTVWIPACDEESG
ncbi:MAG: GAF domain-containing protein [Anaerolineae bacterium]|nr:GAF domain-containing protein [Anaerolineae bacterium]